MNTRYTRQNRGRLNRGLINPREFYTAEGLKLKGVGPWVDAGLCPFHEEHRPSFRVNVDTGRYRCMSCGASGDVVAFVMQLHKLGFVDACKRLGAWEVQP